MNRHGLGIVLLLCAASQSALAQTAEFIPIPGTSTIPGSNENVCILSGTAGYSGVRVSADGRVVATTVYPPGPVIGYIPRSAARWTREGGTQVVTPPLGGLYPVVGLSADGSVLVGEYWRWSTARGYQTLNQQIGGPFGSTLRVLFGCSDDGQTLVGIRGIYPDEGDMFTLDLRTGRFTDFPRAAEVPTGYFYFNTVSGNGRVIGGSTRQFDQDDPFSQTLYGAVVINESGPTLITPQVGQSGVTDLNFDGRVAVGYTTFDFRLRAFRYDGEIEYLDDAIGGSGGSYARAVSADGSVVVGDYFRFGVPSTLAWFYRNDLGFVDLRDYLVGAGGLNEQLAGWQLLVATDISADGRVIVGQGLNPEGCEQAFYARLPGGTPCPADFNNDGGVDADDIIAFFAEWDTGNIAADFNTDGGVDADDVIAFFERWDAGC